MGTHVRLATDEEKGLARKLAEKMEDSPRKNLVKIGEEKYGLRVLPKLGQTLDICVLMPSGNILFLDTTEAGFQIDESLARSNYKGDMTLNGELAGAVSYAKLVEDVYFAQRGQFI